jgi:hypothetical protein
MSLTNFESVEVQLGDHLAEPAAAPRGQLAPGFVCISSKIADLGCHYIASADLSSHKTKVGSLSLIQVRS